MLALSVVGGKSKASRNDGGKSGNVDDIFFPLCPKGSLTSICLSDIGIDFLYPSA